MRFSIGFHRHRAARVVNERLARYGKYHPATFAAYGRAFVLWGKVAAPPAFPDDIDFELRTACCHAYTTGQIRAYRADGYQNRRIRRHYESMPVAAV